MQEGWAVVIGAAIALVGSVGAPWITSRADAAQRRRQQRRDELRAAIAGLIDLMVRAYASGQDIEERRTSHNLASVAVSRLALLLDAAEVVIEEISDHALEPAVLMPAGDPEGPYRVSAFQWTMHRWYRGEIPTTEVRRRYDATLEAFRAGEHPLFARGDRPAG